VDAHDGHAGRVHTVARGRRAAVDLHGDGHRHRHGNGDHADRDGQLPSDSSGAFSNPGSSCTLAPTATSGQASCAVTYTPSAVGSGTHKIAASYGGDQAHQTSGGPATVTITAAAPALTITHIAAAADSHGLAAAGITFTDADTQRPVSEYSGTINWGDGTAVSGMAFVRLRAGQFAGAGVHQYAHPGTYTVVITIKDTGGASAKETTTVTVPARRKPQERLTITGRPRIPRRCASR
jgi:hypothetical protein